MTKHQEVFEKMFKVRKNNVLSALRWLTKYNTLYRDYEVVIKEENLDWMGSSSVSTLPIANSVEIGDEIEDDDGDLGPSPSQSYADCLHKEEAEYDVMGKLFYGSYFHIIYFLC